MSTWRETTNHYADDSDSPAWIAEQTRPDASTGWTNKWTRNILGPDGVLGMIQSSDGSASIQLTDLHGDVVSTMADSTSVTGLANYAEATEFGIPRTLTASLGQHYAWVGANQRSTDDLGGLTLMGHRLYNAETGRFLSHDPVPEGN